MRNIKLKGGEELVSKLFPSHFAQFNTYLLSLVFAGAAFFFMFYLFQKGIVGTVVFCLLLTLSFSFAVKAFFARKKNFLFITSHRIIDIYKRGFLRKEINELSYDLIKDVVVNQNGIKDSIFKTGSIVIIGRGNVKLCFENVRSPVEIQDLILDMREKVLTNGIVNTNDRLMTLRKMVRYLTLRELRRLKKTINIHIQAKKNGKIEN